MRLGETVFGVTVWAVLPGRAPGQRDGLEHLTWQGPGHAVCLRGGGTSDGHMEHYGPLAGKVSGPCRTRAEAETAVTAYLAGPGRGLSCRAVMPGSARPPQSPAAAGATGAAAVPAADPAADENVRALARHFPRSWLECTLRDARLRRDHAWLALKYPPPGRNTAEDWDRLAAASRAAQGRWAAEAWAAVAEYARLIGAEPPPDGPCPDASPYSHGRDNGRFMVGSCITGRWEGYGDREWREYVAGYAAGFLPSARSAVSDAVRAQARRAAGPGPAAAQAFTGQDGKSPTAARSPGAAAAVTSPGTRARPRRPR